MASSNAVARSWRFVCSAHRPTVHTSRAGTSFLTTKCTLATSSNLDEWVDREARPISLRQLTVFGRSLTESRLLSSANYVRQEIPTRIAHRLRDLQKLPYVVITNQHMSFVHDLYQRSFDWLSNIGEIKTIQDNERFCNIIRESLTENLTAIPSLVMGVLETQHLLPEERLDTMMNILLKSRISRRVICEQHLALTDTFNSPKERAMSSSSDNQNDFVGEVFLRLKCSDTVERCAAAIELLSRQVYGNDVALPKVVIRGHLDSTLTYIPSHLEYIIGELLRNSFQAVTETHGTSSVEPPSIEVLICEAPQHVIFRISDQGGGVEHSELPNIWSFVRGPKRQKRMENLQKVPQLAATLQELRVPEAERLVHRASNVEPLKPASSLSSLTGRPPNLRLGIGLPVSRAYAEFWAGSLELHSLEGYGVDVFLQVPKLGNRNEQLTTRASVDSL